MSKVGQKGCNAVFFLFGIGIPYFLMAEPQADNQRCSLNSLLIAGSWVITFIKGSHV